MQAIRLCVLMFVAIAWGVCGADAPAEKPDPALNGNWQVIASQENGKDMPAAELQKMALELRLADGRYTVSAGVADIDAGAYSTNGKTNPKSIDVTPEKGPNKGKKVPSIYKLENETLVICYGFSGKRPTEFATTPGSQLMLLKYTRAK